MDKFVEKSGARAHMAQTAPPTAAQPQIEAPALAYSAPRTSTTPAAMEVSGDSSPTPPPHAPPPQASGENTTERIAQAVAALLSPMIAASVEKAVNAGMAQIKAQLGEHGTRLNELEHRLSSAEEELYQAQATEHAQDKTNQFILQKLDDLENRSRRSNLRFVGVPESLQASALSDFCAQRIPEALGLPGPCTVERAHRMGAFNSDRKSPRPIIAKYLNYADKTLILHSFRQARQLQIDGMKVLVFADYSIEVSKKRKAFQQVCTELFKQQIKFTLAFPAILRLRAPNGDQLTFQDPSEAEAFLRSRHAFPNPQSPSKATPLNRPLDQRSPRKEAPKRFRPSAQEPARSATT